MRGSNLLATALLAVLVVITAAEEAGEDVEIPTKCPAVDPMNTTVHLAHENDCTKFYMCFLGRRILRECPWMDQQHRHRLHFNPKLQVCDWPNRAGCKSSTTDSDGSTVTQPETKPTPTPKPTTTTPTPTTTTPTPTTTTPTTTPTPTTTLTTTPTPTTTPTIAPTTTTTTPTSTTTTELPTTTGDPFESTNGTEAPPTCPGFGNGTIYLPHETDCRFYYACENGTVVLYQCSENLEFDPITQSCDWPKGCVSSSTIVPTPSTPTPSTPTPSTPTPSTPTPSTPTPSTPTPSTPTPSTPTPSTPTPSTPTPSPTPKPPACPPGSNGTLPHECQCDRYYQCQNGDQVLKHCPPGLHWDRVNEVCDTPDKAGCPNYHPSTTTRITTRSTHTTPITTPSKPVEIPSVCPPNSNIKIAHETNCSLYYECVDGNKTLKECLPGLHFDPRLQVCDFPENVDCSAERPVTSSTDDGKVTPSMTPSSSTHTTTPTTVTTPSTVTVTHTTPVPSSKCPKLSEGEVVMIPHETNCSLYYVCQDDERTLEECPKGLHFDPRLQVCDFPDDSVCVDKPPISSSTDDGSVTPSMTPTVSTHSTTVTVTPTESTTTRTTPTTPTTTTQTPTTPTPTTVTTPTTTSTTTRTTVTTSTTPVPSSECPNLPDGDIVDIPHETNCSLYYRCEDGEKTLKHCPAGLHFDPRLQVCDFPENAGCTDKDWGTTDESHVTKTTTKHVTASDGPTVSPSEPTTVVIPTECPPDNSGPVVHLPHETNCSLFYKCDMGEKVVMRCPKGLLYNPKLQLCDWPEFVDCTDKPDHTSDDTHVTKTTAKHVTASDGPTISPTEPTTVVIPTECPPDNSGPVVHLAHETNCSLFYKCDMGEKVVMPCPKGLQFNPKLQLCDWPQNVNCTDKPDHTSDDMHVTQTTTKHVTATDGPTVSPTEPTTVVIPTECPPDNSGPVVHLAHETNCSLFYKCDMGEKVLMACPKGLQFSPKLQLCDWPENVNCTDKPDHTSDDTHVTKTTAKLITASDGPTVSPTEPTTVVIPTECPPDNSGPVVHLAHETNCSLFYKCDMGEKVVMPCPKGLQFNPKLQLCDWPENVNCTNKPAHTSDDSHVTPTVLQTSSSVKPTEPTTVVIPTECPPDNSGQVVQLPHETNCSLFYKCDEGRKVVKSCPDGLLFNPRLQLCDWPANVNCTDKPASTTVQPTSVTTPSVKPTSDSTTQSSVATKPTTAKVTASTADIDDVDEPKCPPNNDGEAIQIPHKTNCSLFYKCDDGKAIIQHCPPGLAFNEKLQVCDWPENANCIDAPKDDFESTASSTAHPTTQPPSTIPLTTPTPNTPRSTTQTSTTTHSTTQTSTTSRSTTQKPSTTHSTTQTPPTTDSFVSKSTDDQPNCVGACPASDPMEYTVLLPNEDCTKFCKCSNGHPYVYDCPAGLHFDPRLHVCNNPRVAGCVGKGRVEQNDDSQIRAEYY